MPGAGDDAAADELLARLSPSDLVVAWLRLDLRLHDQPVLARAAAAAAQRGAAVLVAAFWDDRTFGGTLEASGLPKTSSRRAQFLWESMADLARRLQDVGGALVVYPGPLEVHLPRICTEWQKSGLRGQQHHQRPRVVVLTQASVTPEELEAEAAVEEAFRTCACQGGLLRVWGLTLHHIDDLPYQDVRRELPNVFAPFGRAIRGHFRAADAAAMAEARRTGAAAPLRALWPTPKRFPAPPAGLAEASGAAPLSALQPKPVVDDKRAALHYQGGETAGLARLQEFITMDLTAYKNRRNQLMGKRFSSKLAPWIATGCVSVRRIVSDVAQFEKERCRGRPTPSTAHFTSEFSWRDYTVLLAMKYGPSLFYRNGPGAVTRSWAEDADLFERFLHGRTGMPLIDAAMRELRATGFTSNRARQFLASYLAVELGLDWRLGAETFEHLLLDYDVHANWCAWARAAGVCGNGLGSGGHRWFNLEEEARRFDANGDFVRCWVPELADVPVKLVHTPWRMSEAQQQAAGCRLGVDYPVAPDTASRRSLEGLPVEDVLFETTRDGKRASQGAGAGPGKAGKAARRGSGGGGAGKSGGGRGRQGPAGRSAYAEEAPAFAASTEVERGGGHITACGPDGGAAAGGSPRPRGRWRKTR